MIRRALTAGALLLATSAAAQTARPTLDYASAATIRDTCLAWAKDHKLKVAIAVMDSRGMLVAYAHMDGVTMAGGEIAQWKANSAAKFGRATGDFAKATLAPGIPNVAAMAGGVPIYTKDGVALGGVGTSGGKPDEDAACGTAGVEAAGLVAAKPAPAQ
jgi:glc operon protein GlcG